MLREGAPARVYVGIGSNQGQSEDILAKAVEMLAALPETSVTATSAVYKTAPVGGPEQGDFLNQVVELETRLAPRRLLRLTQHIENEMGRRRTVRWGPRTLDVDILWYHGWSCVDEELEVPHPRMEERRFVLEPLAELAPELVLPSGRTVLQALALVQDQRVSRHTAEGRR